MKSNLNRAYSLNENSDAMCTTTGHNRQYSKNDLHIFLYKDNCDDDEATATLDEEFEGDQFIKSNGAAKDEAQKERNKKSLRHNMLR